MKNLFLAFFMLIGLNAYAQDDILPDPTTHAVVIGVGQFANAIIPTLPKAVQGANAFADSLINDKQRPVAPQDLRLLINENARTASMAVALDDLIFNCKQGDHVIIYFSGWIAGSSERKHQYFITYDSPPIIFVAGAFPRQYITETINVLENEKKVKVTFINRGKVHLGVFEEEERE